MFKVRLTTLNKSDLMLERRLMRRRLPNDQWEYWAEIGFLKTEAEAHAKASPYMQLNLRVEIITYVLATREEQVIKQLRDIHPQQVYEAYRALLPKEKPTLSSVAWTCIVKVGTGLQMLFIFVLAISPIAGAKGDHWDTAIMIGVAAVVIFMLGKHIGKQEIRESFNRV